MSYCPQYCVGFRERGKGKKRTKLDIQGVFSFTLNPFPLNPCKKIIPLNARNNSGFRGSNVAAKSELVIS
jgi:hypothetical protein